MDAYKHALLDGKRYGVDPDAILPIHQFLDSSKLTFCDFRHRALLHNTFGIHLAIVKFGQVIRVGKKIISVRAVCENHVLEDIGCIPTVADWLRHIKPVSWMLRGKPAKRQVHLNNLYARRTKSAGRSRVSRSKPK